MLVKRGTLYRSNWELFFGRNVLRKQGHSSQVQLNQTVVTAFFCNFAELKAQEIWLETKQKYHIWVKFWRYHIKHNNGQPFSIVVIQLLCVPPGVQDRHDGMAWIFILW